MALRNRDPFDAFRSNIEDTFEGMGTVSQWLDDQRTARMYFESADAYLDVSMGPGGNPIVGRGYGEYLFAQTHPIFRAPEKGGFTGRYEEESPWSTLRNITQGALGAAETSRDPARAFSSALNEAIGGEETGVPSTFLAPNYERRLPQGALSRFANTQYVDPVPYGVSKTVYPGMQMLGEPNAQGQVPMIQQDALAAASTGGVAYGGGKAKQSGTRPYEAGSYMGHQWREFATGSGGVERGQVMNAIMPLGGSLTATEGQGFVQRGTMFEQRNPVVRNLTGWTVNDLEKVTGIRSGAIGNYGEDVPVIMGGDKPLYSWRPAHAVQGQVANAYIGVPKSWEDTSWWKGLDERQRRMFRLDDEGGTSGGQVVPRLVMDTIMRSPAGGSTADKSVGMKQFLTAGDIPSMVGGFTPEQISGANLFFTEGPKEPHSMLMAIGGGLGVTKPGDKLFENGKLNRELSERIINAMEPYMGTGTFTQVVRSSQADLYLSKDEKGQPLVPGLKSAEWLDDNRLQVTREFMGYAGPMMRRNRLEYPVQNVRINAEEMRFMQENNPRLHDRVMRTTDSAEGHIGITRAFWASEGMIDLNQRRVQDYGDIKERIGMLASSGAEVGDVARAMVKAGIGSKATALPGGFFAPSARDVLSMSATNPRGEEVSAIVKHYERMMVSPEDAEGYNALVGSIIPSQNWVKTLQSRGAAGISGPAFADPDQDPGTVRFGQAYMRDFARRAYGRQVTPKELAEMEEVMRGGEVVSKFTRFPQSDVQRQNDLYLRMQYDPSLEPNEIGISPLVSQAMRGDNDSDIYRGYTTAFERTREGLRRDERGRLMINNAGMGQVATEESLMQSIVGMLRDQVPGEVAAAEQEIEGQEFRTEAMRLGAIARRVPYYASEYFKEQGKETESIPPGGDYREAMRAMIDKVPDREAAQDKEIGVRQGKALMGRSYNFAIRQIGQRANQLWGPESPMTASVYGGAAADYQKGLDLATYDPARPMGQQGAGDPLVSWGEARLAEGFGSQSLWHGGGYMTNITGGVDYQKYGTWNEEGKREQKHGFMPTWKKPFGKYSLEGATAMARNLLADSAIYHTERTPEQQAASMSETPEQAARLAKVLTGAREWAASMGDMDPEEALRTTEGMRYKSEILREAGLSEEGFWQTQAPEPAALRDSILVRTFAQKQRAGGDEEYSQMIERQRAELEPEFEQMTGQSLDVAMEGALKRSGRIMTMGGKGWATPGASDRESARELAGLLPEIAGGDVRTASRPLPGEQSFQAGPPVKNPNSLDEISRRYQLDLKAAGVHKARLVPEKDWNDFLKKNFPGVTNVTTGIARYDQGQGTAVAIPVPSAATAQAAGVSPYDLTRRSLAHEMGHAYANANPNVRADALAGMDEALAMGSLDEGRLRKQYGNRWREQGASELVAESFAREIGGGPAQYGNESRTGFMMSLGGVAQGFNTAGAATGAGGGGGGGASAGGGGGQGGGPPVAPPPDDQPPDWWSEGDQPPTGDDWGAPPPAAVPPGVQPRAGSNYASSPRRSAGTTQTGPTQAQRQTVQDALGQIDFNRMSPRDLGQMLGTLSKSILNENYGKDPLRSPTAIRMGYEIASGNVGILEGASAEKLASRGSFDELENLQKFEKWMTGEGGAPTGTNRYIAWQLRKMATSDETLSKLTNDEFATPLEQADAVAANRNVSEHALGGKNAVPAQLQEFDRQLRLSAEGLVKHEAAVIKATEGYKELSKEQTAALKAINQEVQRVAKVGEALVNMGKPGEALLNQYGDAFRSVANIQGAQDTQMRASLEDSFAKLSAGGGSFGGKLGDYAQSLYHDLTSGWKMMQVSRLWNMTGGVAIGAEQEAMTQEMAVQGAMASWGGGGQLGPVSQGLLGIQSQRANATAAMGRGAFMAYGGIQGAMSGLLGEAAGVALPAVGAGLVGQSLLGGLVGGPIGLAIGLGAGIIGSGNWLKSIGGDENERDYRMGGGFWQQTVGQLGDMFASGRGLATGALRSVDEYQAMMARGQLMRSGNMGAFEGDTQAQSIVLRHWASQQSGIMSTEQWATTAGQYQAAMGGVTDLNQIPTQMLEQAAMRGYNIQGMTQLAQGLGGRTPDFLPLMQSMLAQPNDAGMITALGQYGGAGQLGLVSPQWFAQNVGGLQEMTGWQSNRFGQLMAGNQQMWSRYAAGEDLGLTGTAYDILGQLGRQDWMMTAEPGTGLPLHTTTGGAYSGRYGALQTGAAQQGGLRGIQWAYITQQNQVAQEQESRQWDRFQMGYAYKTGGTLGGYPGSVPSGLMSVIGSTGGVWGLEDTERQMGYDWQQYQFGYQQQSFDMGNRQFMENWNAKFGRWNVETQWANQDVRDQTAKWARQDEHWEWNWQWGENMADLQYGWQQEDLDQGIRYATGRQKLQLMQQKERATISEGMRGDKADEAKDYWEDMKKFREQDVEKEKERREQRNQWAEEDMLRSKRHHEEQSEMQQDNMDRQRAHFEEVYALQEQRITLDRRYWLEMQKAQADDMRRAKEINEIQRQLREDQYRLNTDAQDAMYRFRYLLGEIGTGIETLTAKARAFNDALRAQQTTPQQEVVKAPYTITKHEGGPVGLFGTAGDTTTTLESGEYVVPRNGALVQRDDRVVELLGRIANLLEEGNGRFTIMVTNPEQGVMDVSRTLDAAYRS